MKRIQEIFDRDGKAVDELLNIAKVRLVRDNEARQYEDELKVEKEVVRSVLRLVY